MSVSTCTINVGLATKEEGYRTSLRDIRSDRGEKKRRSPRRVAWVACIFASSVTATLRTYSFILLGCFCFRPYLRFDRDEQIENVGRQREDSTRAMDL